MRLLMFTGIVILLVLAGCTGSEVPTTSADLEGGAQPLKVIDAAPFQGVIDGTLQTTGTCEPYVLQADFAGSGILSYMGVTDFSGTICSHWTDNIPPFEGTLSGEGTAVAANGDLLYITMEGSYYAENPPPTTLVMWATYTVTGGTGRFIGASGAGALYAEEDLQDLLGRHAAWIRFDGTLKP